MSIFAFYKISKSILQFLSRLTSDSTTFKVAVSHFVFYPCGALSQPPPPPPPHWEADLSLPHPIGKHLSLHHPKQWMSEETNCNEVVVFMMVHLQVVYSEQN